VSIETSCPSCGKRYQVPDDLAGRKAKCKACGGTINIPVLNQNISSMSSLLDEMDATPAVSAKPAGPSDLLPPLPESRPSVASRSNVSRPKKKRGGLPFHVPGSGNPQKNRFFAALLLVVGILSLFFGQREWRLASRAKSTPQKMTVAQLAANGPGDNIYVELTDVSLRPDLAVIEKHGKIGTNEDTWQWTFAWIPAESGNSFGRLGRGQIKVLFGCKCHDEWQLKSFCSHSKYTGLVVNATDSLGADERKLLNEGLHGFDAASCYYFRDGQSPASAGFQMLLLGGGGLSLVLGLMFGVAYFKNQGGD
jgi:hypothetical protein